MIYGLPLIGWIIGFAVHISSALVFWWFWDDVANFFLVPHGLPMKYVDIGFWMIFKAIVIISLVRWICIPKLASVTQTNKDS